MFLLVVSSLLVMALAFLASCSEAALFSVPLAKAKALVAKRKPGSRSLLAIKEDMSYPIGTVVIVNNIATIVGASVLGIIAHKVFGELGLSIFVAVFTFCIIILAEIVPKTLGESYASVIAPLVAPPVLGLMRFCKPVLWLTSKILSKLKPSSDLNRVSEEEIKIMAAMGQHGGSIQANESALIQRIFKLNDITAEDMMTPLALVESIPADLKLGEGRARLLALHYSRLPVVAEDGETVLGLVLTRDLLAGLARDAFDTTPLDYIQEPFWVPRELLADYLLVTFQKRGTHLGIVVDAERRMIGVVSLEDVIEELVGEIADEKDVLPETIKRLAKNEIMVDEGTEIGKINHFFNTTIDYPGTIGDLAVEKFGHRPKVGESVTDGDLTYTIVGMTRTRPKLLRITKSAT